VKLDLHYVDPRLVGLYDRADDPGDDRRFYRQLAAELRPEVIIDLGCGTGLLARELAINGRTVIGIDPAPAMLAYARRQPGAERVNWIEGDSSILGAARADLLLMTGNVAQIFLEDAVWADTLADIHAALRPNGHLAFESRNPENRAWEQWNRLATLRMLETPHGPVEEWLELVSVGDGKVCFEGHNAFKETGELVVVRSELRFRSRRELTESLRRAGFAVEKVYGDWQRGHVTTASRVLVFIARPT
jgi:SAM-dependent methyltransferase